MTVRDEQECDIPCKPDTLRGLCPLGGAHNRAGGLRNIQGDMKDALLPGISLQDQKHTLNQQWLCGCADPL